MDCFPYLRFAIVSLFFWLLPAKAQQVWHDEVLRTYQGLPSDIVLKTQTDSNGFLYVATAKGLCRYDGYGFVQSKYVKFGITDFSSCKGSFYFHSPAFGLAQAADVFSRPQIIRNNNYQDENPDNDHFENIFVDSRDRVWCSDFSSVKYFRKGSTSPVVFPLGKSSEANLKLQFLEIAKDRIWIISRSGIYEWKAGKFGLVKFQDGNSLGGTSAIKVSRTSILLFSPYNSLFKIDTHNGSVERVASTSEEIVGFAKLPGKDLVLYSKNNLYALHDAKLQVLYSAQKSQINHVLADASANVLWISTNKGLVRFSPVDAVSNYKIPTVSFANRVVVSIAEDLGKTIWMADSQGAIWSKSASGIWQSYTLPNAHAKAVNTYGNRIFIPSDKGLFEITRGNVVKIELAGLGNTALKKALLTKHDELWLLCEGAPVKRFSFSGGHPAPINNTPGFWRENTWNDLFESQDGKIWLGGWAPKAYGIDLFDPQKQAFGEISDLSSNANRDIFFGDYVNRIAQDDGGNLLFSGYGGFCIVNPDGKVIRKVDVNAYPIADGRFEGIAADASGNIVFATGDGLQLFNKKRNDITRLSQLDGLPADDLVYGFLKLSDGRFALGTENGFSILDLAKMLHPGTKKTLRLSSVSVDGRMREHVSGAIELSKDESDAVISFSDLSFSDRNKIFFRYRFSDESHWNDLGNNPQITLNHISPGTFKLLVQKKSAFGQWEKDGLELVLVAHPPFYRSPIFYGICGLLMIFCITGIYSYLLGRQRKEAQYRQKIREAEMSTLRAQMNPHFMFNTLNSINSYIIQDQTETASDYLTTFSKLMRSILDYSQQETIPLENELQALRLYMELESMRLEQSFDYTIKVDKELKGNPLAKIPPLVIQPFVENAIWHGLLHKPEPGHLSVSAQMGQDESFTVRIEDDGIGREKAAEIKKKQTNHKSYGIEITIERLKMMHPENEVQIIDLKDESGKARGTAVILTLKL